MRGERFTFPFFISSIKGVELQLDPVTIKKHYQPHHVNNKFTYQVHVST